MTSPLAFCRVFLSSTRMANVSALLAMGIVGLLATVVGRSPVAAAADLVWVGNDAFNNSNFASSGNWQGNTLPSWGFTNSLKFNQNQNSNVTGLNYNWGDWRSVNDILWDTTFPVARTLSASNGGGIDFKTRIENNSSFTQTVAMNLSGGKDGASDIQLNPVKGSLILSGTIYNDNSLDYTVYGSDTGTTTNLTINTELGPNAPSKSSVDFTVAGGRNTAIQVNASQSWSGTTTVNSGAFTTANGVTLASTAIVVGGGTVATTSANTLADTASLTVNTGRLSIGGSDTVASLAGSGGTIDIASGATLTFGNASSTSYAGSITGSGGFTKIGAGVVTLTGNNSTSGGTLVSQGTLMGGASTSFGSGSIVLGDGNTGTSSIILMANSSGNTTIANAITVANLGTGLVSIGGTNTGNTSFNLWNGTLTLNRNVQVFGDTTPGSSGRTSLSGQITGSGGITVTQGRVTLQNGTNNFTGPVAVNSGATLQLDVGGGTNEVIPNSSAVTVNGSLNFASGGTETIGSLAGSGTVSSVVGGNYSLVIGGSASTTFSGVINNGSGTVSLTKSGTGALTLSGTSSYSGTTTISNGTLQVAGLLGGGNYGAAISNNASLAFSNSASQTLSGVISGSGTLTKAGLGTLTLSQANSYSGGTVVSQGTLMGGASTSFGSGSIVLGDGNTGTSSVVLVANSSGNTTIANAITVANLGTGLVSIGGTNTGSGSYNAWTGTLTLNRNVQLFGDTTPGSSGRTSFLGQITGSGGITVTQGCVTLQSTTNNFTGPVVVNSGATLQLDVANGINELIPNSSAVTVNGALNFASGGGTETIGSLAGSGTVSSIVGGTYRLVVGGSDSTTFSGVINNGSGVIGLTKSGAGTQTLSGTSSYSGGTIVSAGQLVGTTASLQGAITNNASVAFDQATTGNYANTMSGSGSLTKLGVGTLRITGSNGYSGGTTITNGTVEVSAGGSAGGSAAALGTGTVAVASGAQVTYWLSNTNAHTIFNAFSLSGGTLYTEDGANTFSGQVALASGASTISSRYEDTITLSGGLAGSGNVLFTQAGGTGGGAAPTFVLSGTGANTGTVRVSGSLNGTVTKLRVANVNALQSATLDMATGDVGTVEFTVPGTNTYSLGGLQGSRNLSIGANSLSVGSNGQSTTYSGVLTGSGSLTKVGGGRLALTGANTFSGTTNVQAGALALDGSIVGSLSVASLASLSGTGTVGGNATIAGTHSPGNSPGVQTFNGNLTYQAGAVVNWELIANTTGTPGTNYDQIIVPTGNLAFSGSTTLALSFDSLASSVDWADPFWNVNRSWTVYDLSGGTTNSLSNLGLGGSLLDSLNQPLSPTGRGYFTTSLSGQDVMLNFVAVPEPLTLPLVGIAAAFLLIRRRAAR